MFDLTIRRDTNTPKPSWKGEGIRVWGDVVLLDFWCRFAGIFIFAVLQNQPVCSLREHPVFIRFFWLKFRVSPAGDRPRFTCSKVLCGKKGVNHTKTRTGDGAHGLKSCSKRERHSSRPAHKYSLWMVGQHSGPTLDLRWRQYWQAVCC